MATDGKETRPRKARRPKTADQVRDALREPESERGRAALVALLDYVAFVITADPQHGADLAADIYSRTGTAVRRSRHANPNGECMMSDDLERHHASFRIPLLAAVDDWYRDRDGNRPEIERARESAREREARAYLARFTGRTAEVRAEERPAPKSAPGVEARIKKLRDRLNRLDEDDITSCTARLALEKKIYDLERAAPDAFWPEYIGG